MTGACPGLNYIRCKVALKAHKPTKSTNNSCNQFLLSVTRFSLYFRNMEARTYTRCVILTILLVHIGGETSLFKTKLGTAHMSKSSWVLSFYLDLAPITRQLDKLDNLLDTIGEKLNLTLATIEADSRLTPEANKPHNKATSNQIHRVQQYHGMRIYSTLTNLTRAEFKLTKHHLFKTRQTLDDLVSRKEDLGIKRPKRGIFTGIISVLDLAFGISNRISNKKLEKGIRQLAASNQLHHIQINELTSITNMSAIAINKNRLHINELNKIVGNLNTKLQALDDSMISSLTREALSIKHSELSMHLNILNDALSFVQFQISQLKRGVDAAILGQMTAALVEPTTLRGALTTVEKNIPDDLKLPFSAKGASIWNYYKNIKTDIIMLNNQLACLSLVDLDDIKSLYELYHVISFPVITGSNSLEYLLETEYLAISTGNNRYIHMNEMELTKCVASHGHFCHVLNPAYSFTHSPSCVSAVFKDNHRVISETCKFVTNKVTKPYAKYLGDNMYAIAYTENLEFKVVCHNSSKVMTTNSPLDFLKLHSNCEAYNALVTLNTEASGFTNIGAIEFNGYKESDLENYFPDDEFTIEELVHKHVVNISKVEELPLLEPLEFVRVAKLSDDDIVSIDLIDDTNLIIVISVVGGCIVMFGLLAACLKRKWNNKNAFKYFKGRMNQIEAKQSERDRELAIELQHLKENSTDIDPRISKVNDKVKEAYQYQPKEQDYPKHKKAKCQVCYLCCCCKDAEAEYI